MHLPPAFEKAEAYLNLHLSRTGPGYLAQPPLPFITLSREAGAGASSLAHLLVNRLNPLVDPDEAPWTIFDSNIVDAMLEEHRYPAALARYLPEDSVSEVSSAAGEIMGLHPNLWELTQRTNDLIRKLARLGHCILIGRGANFATRHLPQGVHLRLIGSPPRRAAHMASVLGITESAAAARNLQADIARRRYVQSTFGQSIDDPSVYDLIINTDNVSLDEAAELVVRVVSARYQTVSGR
jgi:cytidylate kinase